MKKILAVLVLGVSVLLSGCSFAAFRERYEKTPAHAKSVGEGRDTFTYEEGGKTYVLVRGTDGKYYVVGTEGGK